jgi:hypothetical protein
MSVCRRRGESSTSFMILPARVAKRGVVTPIKVDLGRDDRMLATAVLRDGLAENLVDPAEAVDGRGVER